MPTQVGTDPYQSRVVTDPDQGRVDNFALAKLACLEIESDHH